MLLSEFYGINSMPIALLHSFMGGDKMPGTQGENIFTHDVLVGYRCNGLEISISAGSMVLLISRLYLLCPV